MPRRRKKPLRPRPHDGPSPLSAAIQGKKALATVRTPVPRPPGLRDSLLRQLDAIEAAAVTHPGVVWTFGETVVHAPTTSTHYSTLVEFRDNAIYASLDVDDVGEDTFPIWNFFIVLVSHMGVERPWRKDFLHRDMAFLGLCQDFGISPADFTLSPAEIF